MPGVYNYIMIPWVAGVYDTVMIPLPSVDDESFPVTQVVVLCELINGMIQCGLYFLTSIIIHEI